MQGAFRFDKWLFKIYMMIYWSIDFLFSGGNVEDKTLYIYVFIDSDLKQGDALSPFLFNFALAPAICELPLCADDSNVLDENVINIRNTEILLQDSSENGAEVSTEKTEYMFMSRH
jgi:hypothetical protein